jgi:hypothetical protein
MSLCDNCGLDINENEDDPVFVVDPKTKGVQIICRPCDKRIPWQTMFDEKLKKPVLYYGDLT